MLFILWRQYGNARINRYIVGCKFLQNYVHLAAQEGINRYIVGCKYLQQLLFLSLIFELIDT